MQKKLFKRADQEDKNEKRDTYILQLLRKRNDAEKKLVDQAKALLMERNNMSEDEAHRYLQKSSMDSGTNLMETAQMILTILNE